MLRRILILLILGLSTKCDNPVTTTTSIEATTPPDPFKYCEYFPQDSDVDEGNYGDAECYIEGNFRETLLLRDFIVTSDGQTRIYNDFHTFRGSVVTRIRLINLGRFHGATKVLHIYNDENGIGSANIEIDIFSGKGIRMMWEIYGYSL
ncbi:hypothetical protein TcasGA2_TC032890 [Tribolium castaneum]|uniref:Lipoprotein n=1 Tax=Tribolium castaneum TaxID=7070 RepID=A0A139WJF1_TRICA|nr:hypothetical protein TcasGA2_TC032890 [Tribolium castaneum]